MNPNYISEIAMAITKEEITQLINTKDKFGEPYISRKPVTGISRTRIHHRQQQKAKGRRSGPAHRKGKKTARLSKKQVWMNRIRPIRRRLRELRESGAITRADYRKFYSHATGGMFHSVNHMETQMRMKKVLKED